MIFTGEVDNKKKASTNYAFLWVFEAICNGKML